MVCAPGSAALPTGFLRNDMEHDSEVRKQMGQLKLACLKIGGKRFQIDDCILGDLSDELNRTDWQKFSGRRGKVRIRRIRSCKGFKMEPCHCHNNAAVVATERGWELWTGMALSDDGVWRVHSWVRIPSTGTIGETTMSRVVYYGVRLRLWG